LDFHQAEPLCGSRHPGHPAAQARKHSVDFPRASGTATDLHQRSDHDAHHIPQKPFSTHINMDHIPIRGHGNGKHFPHRRAGGAPAGTKSGKIVLADEQLRRLLHALQIEITANMPTVPAGQRGPHGTAVKGVPVPFSGGTEAGMKIIVNQGRIPHDNILRQIPINPLAVRPHRQ
jgi:hypothetical protein